MKEAKELLLSAFVRVQEDCLPAEMRGTVPRLGTFSLTPPFPGVPFNEALSQMPSPRHTSHYLCGNYITIQMGKSSIRIASAEF